MSKILTQGRFNNTGITITDLSTTVASVVSITGIKTGFIISTRVAIRAVVEA